METPSPDVGVQEPPKKRSKVFMWVIPIIVLAVVFLYFFPQFPLPFHFAPEDTRPGDELVDLGELNRAPFEHLEQAGELAPLIVSNLELFESGVVDTISFTHETMAEVDGQQYFASESGSGVIGSFTTVVTPNSELPWDTSILGRIPNDATVILLYNSSFELSETVDIYRIIIDQDLL